MRGSAMPAGPIPWLRSLGPLVLAGLRQRYAGSLLGALWNLLAPLFEVAIYVALFSLLLRGGDPASRLSLGLAVTAGLLPWAALREGLDGSAAALPENRWIRRSTVPVELLVGRLVLVAAARGLVGLLLVQAGAALAGGPPSAAGLLLPLVGLALQVAATWGLALGIAPLAVLYPDLRPALASALTLLTFASPIVYPESMVGAPLMRVLEWNPYTHFLRLFRVPLASPQEPLPGLLIPIAATALMVGLGVLVRQRLWWAARDRL